MIHETNFQLKIHTQTAWVVGKAGSEIPREPARIEDVVYVKRDGVDVLAYRVQYQSGRIAYVFLDEKINFEIVSFAKIVNGDYKSTL